MGRLCTNEEKLRALDILDACAGNLQAAAAQSGWSSSTLSRWRKQVATLRAERAHLQMLKARQRMAEKSLDLVQAIDDERITAAPLNQLSAALGVLVDRYLKLDGFDQAAAAEGVIRFEYRYPDGSFADAPPWAADDSQASGALQSGGLRSPLRQNGAGQAGPAGTRLARRRPYLVARPDLSDGEPGLAGFEDGAAAGGGLFD